MTIREGKFGSVMRNPGLRYVERVAKCWMLAGPGDFPARWTRRDIDIEHVFWHNEVCVVQEHRS